MEHINSSLDKLGQQLKAYFKILDELSKNGSHEHLTENLRDLLLMTARVKKMAHYVDGEMSDVVNKLLIELRNK